MLLAHERAASLFIFIAHEFGRRFFLSFFFRWASSMFYLYVCGDAYGDVVRFGSFYQFITHQSIRI